MKIPKLQGLIDRRILINYQVEPEILAGYLPSPFKPQLVKGKGIVGICLIRLKDIRPQWGPSFLGIQSENGAHRIAVEWLENNVRKIGVYIPRRDTSSRWNAWAGGLIFPGIHHRAKFQVKEENQSYKVSFISEDNTQLSIHARETNTWNRNSVFENIEEASDFFEKGFLGYSPAKDKYDGLLLKTDDWKVTPLAVESVHSSFFANEQVFPKDSVQFDNALLMKSVSHEWQAAPGLLIPNK